MVLYFIAGTRIIYERKFLLQMQNSPLSRSPPKNMASIPGVTLTKFPVSSAPSTSPQPPTVTSPAKKESDTALRQEGSICDQAIIVIMNSINQGVCGKLPYTNNYLVCVRH